LADVDPLIAEQSFADDPDDDVTELTEVFDETSLVSGSEVCY